MKSMFRKRSFIAALGWLVCAAAGFTQSDHPQGIEGGRGYIHTHSAQLTNKGFLGFNFQTFYNIREVERLSHNEHRLIGVGAFTYGLSDELEYTANLYAIAQGTLSSSDAENDRLRSGFGNSGMAIKYKLPISSEKVVLSTLTGLNFPMGYNFSSYPSYPFDTNVYEIDLMLLETIKMNDKVRLHLNQGYRVRG